MYNIIVDRECGCFKRSDMEASTKVESKDEALILSMQMKDTMNNKFCKKHTFYVKEEGNQFIIAMNA